MQSIGAWLCRYVREGWAGMLVWCDNDGICAFIAHGYEVRQLGVERIQREHGLAM
jgi:hypothetical protein